MNNKNITKLYQQYVSEMKSYTTDLGEMKYTDNGSGKPILLVHGVPTSSWMYRDMSHGLSKNGYRVISIDMIGFGGSDKPTGYDIYDFDKQADRILGLMNYLGIHKWEQVIHDMGGIITWEMMKKNSSKISELYILNTLLYRDDFHPPIDFSYKNKLHLFFLKLYKNSFIGKMMIKGFLHSGTKKHSFSSEVQAGYWLPLRDGVDALIHFFTHTKWIKQNLAEYRKVFKGYSGKISLIWGKHDSFLDVKQVLKFQNDFNISDENILIIENAKHLIPEEASDDIIKYILK